MLTSPETSNRILEETVESIVNASVAEPRFGPVWAR